MKPIRNITFIAVIGLQFFFPGFMSGQGGQIVDIDNNYYDIVTIGTQVWMVQNLNVTRYADDSAIPLVQDSVTWSALTRLDRAYSWYDNNTINGDAFGILYTWAAANRSDSSSLNPSGIQGVCPDDWHIPSDDEWKQLEMNLGMTQVEADKVFQWRGTDEGGQLKSTDLWESPNTGASNSSGFDAKPGGMRQQHDGSFTYLTRYAYLWSSTGDDVETAWCRQLSSSEARIWRVQNFRRLGKSVRCVHDGGTLHTTSTLVTDRVEGITQSSAECFADFVENGNRPSVTKGVCWSTSPNPTTDDFFTDEGPGYTAFSSTMDGLLPNTTYYVRAYGENTVGIAYGNEISFSTTSVNPQDSLALVALYNSTNGPGWTDNSNWTTGPVNSWFGIWLSSGEVVQIRMPFNNLDGTIPPEFWNLENLQSLDLQNNNLSGALPSEIGNLTNLYYLRLGFNQLSGSIPSEIQNFSNLIEMVFQHNQFTGSIPNEIGTLSNLQILNLGENSLSGPIPESIGNLSNVWSLQLQDNELSGNIPSIIGGLENLRNLYLRGNLLTGTIPIQIYNLTNLESILLADNQIIGPLAEQISNLVNLDVLEVSSNQLTGPVPESITTLNVLQTLGIRNNMFTSLPDLSPMMNLSRVYIENNQFNFDDIVPLVGNGYLAFTYSPQANIETESDVTVHLGEEVVFTVNAGGVNSEYQWSKDGDEYEIPLDVNTLTISPVNLSDAGDYACYVTNSDAPDLILLANPATLDVIDAIQVTNTNNAGPGSLRYAINYANTHPGRDSIVFNISGPGPHTIQPSVPLPLPFLTTPVIIDGYTQSGSVKASGATPATLMIELNGYDLIDDPFTSGLNIRGGNTTIRGLAINRFGDAGIHIEAQGDNVIEGNHIGTDIGGGFSQANVDDGIRIMGSPNNTVGGNLSSKRNIISGNGDIGIEIQGSGAINNHIEGNYIGLNATGDSLGNHADGVLLIASHNFIGGSTIGSGNVISGNVRSGVSVITAGAESNEIRRNYIGTDASGSTAVPNGVNGVTIDAGASDNFIGYGNVISGNTREGVEILSASLDNQVFGNYIGTTANGLARLGNHSTGIMLRENASYNIIGPGNVISGNDQNGIHISNGSIQNRVIGNFIGTTTGGLDTLGNLGAGVAINSSENMVGGPNLPDRNIISANVLGVVIQGPDAINNDVVNNRIGTDTTGTKALGNTNHGIFLGEGSGNTIGPDNLISGNHIFGVLLIDNAHDNQVKGNYIGTNYSGTDTIPNKVVGVHILRGQHNLIGGEGEGNVISGNQEGILIYGSPFPQNDDPVVEANGNSIIGNLIGTTYDGGDTLANTGNGIRISFHADSTIIGSTTDGSRNVISGNEGFGLVIEGDTGTRVMGNYIGTDATGEIALGNLAGGIWIGQGSSYNTVGGTTPAERNVISGNTDNGIQIEGVGSTGNLIQGNYMGTNAIGDDALVIPAAGTSIRINGAPDNTIGPGNVISGNYIGISIGPLGDPSPENAAGNWIRGNKIGTNADGTAPVPNTFIGINAPSVWETTIGGLEEVDRNIISGNSYGIVLAQPQGKGNVVQGNYIGTDVTGTDAIGNGNGIWIGDKGNGIIIGGNTPEARNVISGNWNGVSITEGSYGNTVQGNYIGTTKTGTTALGNGSSGIMINGPGNVIGGADEGEGNLISGNHEGIMIRGQQYPSETDPFIEASGNLIIGNLIGTTNDGGDTLANTGNGIRISFHADSTIIGGSTVGSRNVISGNEGFGLVIEGDTGTRVMGNFIGTDATGEFALGNLAGGIWIGQGSYYNIVGGTTSSVRNVISGNGADNLSHGVVISDAGSTGNKITRNYIGLDASGKTPVGNQGDGVQIINGASGNIIGGSINTERNVISGNGVTGIAIYGDANENKILGNFIGLDASGLVNIGHPGGTGVYLGLGASNNIIGSNNAEARNYIAGNTGWAGVAIDGSGTDYNEVLGNIIGMDPSGGVEYGNLIGVRIYNGASNNLIGGMEYGVGNYITNNIEAGVRIYNDEGNLSETTGNQIISNSIHSNGSLGIDLDTAGVSWNDEVALDEDIGPNNLQNYPVLDSLSFTPLSVTVGGYLRSRSESMYIIQFFASRIMDHSTHGEGETYLGSDTVYTDDSGIATFLSEFNRIGGGQVITTTATDIDGNTSEFSLALGGVKDQILAEFNRPFHYSIHDDGLPNVFNGTDTAAIRKAFQTWMDIPTADLEFSLDGMTSVMNASATDGINLVTFRDERFPIPPGVLAIAAKTLKLNPGDQVAEILDADIVFNPDYVNNSPDLEFGIWEEGDTTIFDVQSVTTHEIGHVLGLIHTGAPSSTMFYALGTDTINQSLEPDDMAWASYRYPTEDFSDSYAFISGKVSYGEVIDENYDEGHPPVAGALVLAVDTTTRHMIHAYTDANGDYKVPVPAHRTDSTFYWIQIQPLDGDVFTYDLRPGNISSYIYSHTIYTDFPDEWYDENEGANDISGEGIEIGVLANQEVDTINFITNLDTIPPTVRSVVPIIGSDSVAIRPDIQIRFSETVDKVSFTSETCYLVWEEDTIGGSYTYLKDSTHIILFRPDESLKYETIYKLHIDSITDTKDNMLEEPYSSWFETMPLDLTPPEVTGLIPEDKQDSVFVTDSIMVFFSKPMDKDLLLGGFNLSVENNPDVNGSFDLDPHNKVLTFRPLFSLVENKEYTITLADTIKDLAGNTLGEGHVYTFETVPEAAPEIIYLGPVDGEDSITIETPVVVDFTEPIDRSTITSSTFNLLNGNNMEVPGSFEYLVNDSRVIFRPEANLNLNEEYTIILKGGEGGIYDVSEPESLPLEQDVTSSFETSPVPTQPYIEYIYPQSGVVGAIVTIIGNGFDPKPENNKVYFFGTEAIVRSATLSALTVEVPLGAKTGPVDVAVNGVVSYNTRFFYVIPESLDPCDADFANAQSGTNSRSVVMSPDAAYAYVTNYDDNTVSVISLLNPEEPIDPIIVGKSPLMIAMNPEGTRAYVTNHMSHTVSVIDTDPFSDNFNKEIKVINVGAGPYGVAASADKRVYVANYYSGTVDVIDVDKTSGGFNRLVSNMNTGTRNRSIAVAPDAGLALVTGDDGLNLITFTPGGDYSDAAIKNVNAGTKTRDASVRPDAGFAIVTTEEGNLFIVDIYPGNNFGNVISNVNSGSRARSASISPDALFVYVTMTDPDEVAVYRIDYGGVGLPSGSYYSNISLVLHNTIPLGEDAEPKALAIDPDAKRLVVIHSTFEGTKDSLRAFTICCGPIPVERLIGDIIVNIQNLIRTGIIDHPNGDPLVSKLNTALQHLDEGDVKGTIKALDNFIKKVKQMMKKSRISEEQGDNLIEQAEAIITQLDAGKKSAEVVVGIEDFEVPGESSLGPIYPNPFNHSTTIRYVVSATGNDPVHVRLAIFNSTGQVVTNLVDQKMTSGQYTVEWDAKYHDDRMVADGIYYVRLTAGSVQLVEKAVVIR